MKANYKTKYHKDGTVTYWSVYRQEWIKKTSYIPDKELTAMAEPERARVQNHIKA